MTPMTRRRDVDAFCDVDALCDGARWAREWFDLALGRVVIAPSWRRRNGRRGQRPLLCDLEPSARSCGARAVH